MEGGGGARDTAKTKEVQGTRGEGTFHSKGRTIKQAYKDGKHCAQTFYKLS